MVVTEIPDRPAPAVRTALPYQLAPTD